MSKRTSARGRSNAPSTRSLGPAQERPDAGLDILFRWLERHPQRPPEEQIALARTYQAARLELWQALLASSAEARAVVEDEAEARGFELPVDLPPEGGPDLERRLAALAVFARLRDTDFRLSRDFAAVAPDLFRRAERLRKTLCEQNLRLVVRIAKRYRAPADPHVTFAASLPFADLIQEGTAGLLRACDLFDPERGWRFSTYAAWWIRHGINRGLAAGSRVVHLPGYVTDLIGRCSKAEGAFLSRHGRLPTDEELAQALEVPVPRASLTRHATAASRMLPLDPPHEDEEGDGADEGDGDGASGGTAWREVEAALLATLDPPTDAPAPSEEVTAALDALAAHDAAAAAVAAPPAEGACPTRAVLAKPAKGGRATAQDRAQMRAAIELRWGLWSPKVSQLTYDDIGRALGVGRETARALCARAEDFVRAWIETARKAAARPSEET